MNRREILIFINEAIEDEKGLPITMNGKFADSQLDSLGSMLTISTIDAEFGILSCVDDISALKLPSITTRELVHKCLLSTTNTSKARKEKKIK